MPPMVNRRGNASRFPTTTSTTPSETPSTPVQIQEATKMLMTHEEIKTALLEGKILYRNKKNDTRVEYKAQADKFLRRETLPGQEPGEWTKSDIRTACKYEWNIIERKQEETEMKQEETEMKQEEPTTDVIRQVALGDGTSTIITEKVPVSEAPVVVDPFATPKVKEDLMAISKKLTEMNITSGPEEEEEEEGEVEEPQTMSALQAINVMMEGYNVMWVPLEKDHDLQVMFYHDWDEKYKEVRANSKHISEYVDMNEFFQHTFVRVEEDYDSFINCLSYISENDTPCYMRNIVTGRIIRGPACMDDSDAEADEDCNIYPTEPLEVGTILPIELRTFWTIEFGEVE